MEWLDTVAKLGLTGTSALLACAVKALWQKTRAQEKEIARLNDARIADLRAIAERDD